MIRQILVTSMRAASLGFEKSDHHFTRYAMYAHLAKAMAPHVRRGRVLAISHSIRLGTEIGLDMTDAVEANYPDARITAIPHDNDEFDFVLSDQVLEHVEDEPQLAFDESLRVLRAGGIAVHTTCLINPVHGHPSDYWRFTPQALSHLARKFNRIIDAGGWGNRGVLAMMALGLRYEKVPLSKRHPLNWLATTNEVAWPISTWIVAQK